ncbi:MAG: Ig-like domain-containing protein [Pseudomonadota bacterium]
MRTNKQTIVSLIVIAAFSCSVASAQTNELQLAPDNILATGSNSSNERRTIYEYTPDGVLIRAVPITPTQSNEEAAGIGVGPDGRLYVVLVDRFDTSRLVAVDRDGAILSSYNLPRPNSSSFNFNKLAFSDDGTAFISGAPGVVTVDLRTASVETLYSSTEQVYDVVVLPSGNLLIAERRAVFEIDATTGDQIRQITLSDPNGLAISVFFPNINALEYDEQRNLIYVSEESSPTGLYAYDFNTGILQRVVEFRSPADLFVSDDTVLVGSFDVPSILSISDLSVIRPFDQIRRFFVSRYFPVPSPLVIAFPDDDQAILTDSPSLIDVLRNDVGFGENLTVTIEQAAENGTATVLNSPGTRDSIRIEYLSDPGFIGFDTFSYRVNDGVNTDVGFVTVRVTPARANDDSYIAIDGISQDLPVLENDIGFASTATLTITSSPDQNGSASPRNFSGEPAFINYRPRCCGSAPPTPYIETFEYSVTDNVNTDRATVRVEVLDGIAQDDLASTNAATPIDIRISDNDLGFNNFSSSSPPTVDVFTVPANGTVTFATRFFFDDPPYKATYTPNPGFLGVDIFQYAVDNGNAVGIATVTVNVIVDPDNDFIDASEDNCTEAANTPQRDTDGDGFGNFCDGDFNNDGFTNFADLSLFRATFGTTDPDGDLNGDGIVNFSDLGIFRGLFGKAPGPSGTN